jgi:Cathepsin propeptide inhibitor domain (I29)
MTDRGFEYEESLLKSCARSGVALFFERNLSFVEEESEPSSQRREAENDDSCVHLFELHALHYGRRHAKEDSRLVRKAMEDTSILSTENTKVSYSYEVGGKMEAFINNVILVERHNSASDQLHRVTLNRFSDLRPSEVLIESAGINPEDLWSEKARRLAVADYGGGGLGWSDGEQDRESMLSSAMNGMTVLLSTSETIMDVAANLAIGHGSMHQLYKHKKKDHHNKDSYKLYPKTIQLPTAEDLNDGEEGRFQTPALEPGMDGVLLSIRRNQNYQSQRGRHHKHSSDAYKENGHEGAGTTDNDFTSYLNWATSDNPDGISIVHDAIDQVSSLGVHGARVLNQSRSNEILLFSLGYMRIMLGFFSCWVSRG